MSDNNKSGDKKQSWFMHIYDKQYKNLLIFTFALLFIAIALIVHKEITTGDFVDRGVSLKGGVVITVLSDRDLDTASIEHSLRQQFPDEDLAVRSLGGAHTGIVVETSIDFTDTTAVESLKVAIEKASGIPYSENSYSVEGMGSALGASFFSETMKAVLIAFLFMGTVVFLYFRLFVPSIAIILSAFSDLVITLAIFNLLGLKLSTGGIAAFLMVIGYAVDTDILLSTRVLKRKSGSILETTVEAMKTGATMNLASLAALTVTYFLTPSEVLKQIMLILIIGLIVDFITTWIQNAAILRWYLERHPNRGGR